MRPMRAQAQSDHELVYRSCGNTLQYLFFNFHYCSLLQTPSLSTLSLLCEPRAWNPNPLSHTMNCSSKSLSLVSAGLFSDRNFGSFSQCLCLWAARTVSGEVPEEPVVSAKSGLLFEKRLIERHISVCMFVSGAVFLCVCVFLGFLFGSWENRGLKPCELGFLGFSFFPFSREFGAVLFHLDVEQWGYWSWEFSLHK